MQKRDRRTREERALRRAQTLLRLAVLLWIAVLLLLLLCLLSPDCLAAEAEAMAAAAEEPDVTWLAVIGAAWLTYRGMTLVLKLDEPRKKRRSK